MLVLEEIFKDRKHENTDQFNLRIQRGLSWLKKAIDLDQDIDLKFILCGFHLTLYMRRTQLPFRINRFSGSLLIKSAMLIMNIKFIRSSGKNTASLSVCLCKILMHFRNSGIFRIRKSVSLNGKKILNQKKTEPVRRLKTKTRLKCS